MILKTLKLQDFRQFQNKLVNFNDDLTVIKGPNAAGKTTIVEALSLLSSGSSFRASKIDDMIRFNQEIGRVELNIKDDGDTDTFEMMLTHGKVQGKRTAKRLYSLNKVRKRKKDVIGQFHTTVFRPEDMRLVEGSPSRRRQFVDMVLSSLSFTYSRSLSTYEQALRKRNKLLEQVREGQFSTKILHYWDQQMIKHGRILQEHRESFLNSFRYVEFPIRFEMQYQPSLISITRMDEYRQRSIAAGYTLIGPHKDDFEIMFYPSDSVTLKELSEYGSRGQQRLGVLWLKIGEFEYIKSESDQAPILILDDILSELDEHHQQLVMKLFDQTQTIVTTADQHLPDLLENRFPDLELLEIKDNK